MVDVVNENADISKVIPRHIVGGGLDSFRQSTGGIGDTADDRLGRQARHAIAADLPSRSSEGNRIIEDRGIPRQQPGRGHDVHLDAKQLSQRPTKTYLVKQ